MKIKLPPGGLTVSLQINKMLKLMMPLFLPVQKYIIALPSGKSGSFPSMLYILHHHE
ncbi:hypothetical protein [Scandinavium sp.]|uniref:hypothetical protein n=1 Tax=Scandinavium sp. TaxID=2830653 RepID=UPI0028A0876E|nr:hypothetical protein [Scandinavium sp.]